MRIEDFNQRLRDGIVVADGAMGSALFDALGPQRSLDELNATHAEEIFRVHHAYIEAGAQMIETNTFGANRRKLDLCGLSHRVTELNHKGVKAAREAREAARHEVLIAGSMGPLGTRLNGGAEARQEAFAAFREQAGALEERGVDLFVLETFSDAAEISAAIDAIRSFSRLPIIAQLTFSDEGVTLGGMTPAEVWTALKERDIQAIGANCTVGPQLLLPVLRELSAASSLPLAAMPNTGFPQRLGDRTIYPRSTPEYFFAFAQEACDLGTRVLGGCCGTTPAHIRAIADAVKKVRPGKMHTATTPDVIEPSVIDAGERARRIAARAPESGLWAKIQAKKFVVSVEIDPPKGVAIDRILEQVRSVMASGQVDCIDVNSGTLGRVGLDALVMAGALEAHGVETIAHLTARDASIIGLQAQLLGAWTVGGLRNVLAITGDPPSVGGSSTLTGVYQVDSIGLVQILSKLNQGIDWNGKNLGGATNFTIGVAVNPVAENLEEEIKRFAAKIEAGAHFAMTQPIFDPEHWHAFVQKLGGPPPIPVLVGIWPLTSHKQALRLNNEVPGIVIPEAVLREMEAAGEAARDRGFAVARRMLDWARTARESGIVGAYLIPPFKRYEEILDLFR
jgi:homocysteine S-methyltransferase